MEELHSAVAKLLSKSGNVFAVFLQEYKSTALDGYVDAADPFDMWDAGHSARLFATKGQADEAAARLSQQTNRPAFVVPIGGGEVFVPQPSTATKY